MTIMFSAMAVVKKVISRPPLPLELDKAPADGSGLRSLEDRLAYLRRRRRPDWWFWLLTTLGVIAMLGWLLAEAVGLLQSA
jgi:hypothetical protein